MTRRTFWGLVSLAVLVQLSGCCWQRPGFFNRGCYPYCNSFGAGPIVGGPIAGPVVAAPPADCPGCGVSGPFSAASLKAPPYALGQGVPEPLAVAPAPLHLNQPPAYATMPGAGLPVYPAGQPVPSPMPPMGSTPLPSPMITKEEGKKN